MFKWCCLAVAVLFLSLFTWMLNDLRLHVRRSGEEIQRTAATVNEHLPALVARGRTTTEAVARHLPVIVEKTRTTTETLAELAQDIRQLKELAGVNSTARDKGLVAYANSVLGRIESSGGTIGLKKLGRRGLKDTLPAREWVAGARKKAAVLTVLSGSRKEVLTGLARTKYGYGSHWYIQVGGEEPQRLLDWVKANHPQSKEL
jgi:hypothetical protein